MKKFQYSLFLIGLGLILLATVFILIVRSTSNVNAQCGSQASSCKNCHETQGQDPVNNDGTGWHQSHAFGDFCYLCHAGNQQSMDKDTAHAGMAPPLSDAKASCQSCHPDDYMDKAQVYAATLGVEVGSGGGAPPSSSEAPPSAESPASEGEEPVQASESETSASPEIVLPSSEIIDYSQLYEETVLGKRTINWGNVILWVIILAIALGGGIFVYWNERRLRGLPRLKFRKKEISTSEVPIVEGYSTEITSLLPLIAQLNPVGLHSLKRLLENPDDASELLHSLSQLDPDLVRRIRALDKEARHMLMALAGR